MPPILPVPRIATFNPGIEGAGARTSYLSSLIPKGYQTRRNGLIRLGRFAAFEMKKAEILYSDLSIEPMLVTLSPQMDKGKEGLDRRKTAAKVNTLPKGPPHILLK